MPYMNPDHLDSEELRQCTDFARFCYPHLFLGSNGYGRLELNYRFIVQRCFRGFRDPPSNDTFWHLVAEYQERRLLFVYKIPDSRLWGQWYISPRFGVALPKYKTARDRQSPTPPEPEYSEWAKQFNPETNLPLFPERFGRLLANFGNFSKLSTIPEDFRRFPRVELSRVEENADFSEIVKIYRTEGEEREKDNASNSNLSLSLGTTNELSSQSDTSENHDERRNPPKSAPIQPETQPEEKAKDANNGFEDFWTPYPRKGHHRPRAESAWRTLVPNGKKPKALACLKRYLASQEVADGVILNPENFIRENALTNWDAEWPPAKPKNSKGPTEEEVLQHMKESRRT